MFGRPGPVLSSSHGLTLWAFTALGGAAVAAPPHTQEETEARGFVTAVDGAGTLPGLCHAPHPHTLQQSHLLPGVGSPSCA